MKKLVKCALSAGMLLLFSSLGSSLADDDLIADFAQRSVPVFEIQQSGETIIVKFRYEKIEDLSAEKMESDQATALMKIAAEFPGSKRIRLEYYLEDEIIIINEYNTSEAVRFAEGNINKTDLLADASLDIQGGRDDLFSSELQLDSFQEDEAIHQGEDDETEEDPDKTPAGGPTNLSNPASYLGAQYRENRPVGIRIVNILKDSPADYSGLRVGDAILEIENKKIQPNELSAADVPEFIYSLPSDRPLRFHIIRNGKQFDVFIKLEPHNKDQIERWMNNERRRLENLIEEGKRYLSSGDYDQAIRSFSAAKEAFPLRALQGMGIAFYNKRYYDDAFYYLARAFSLNPKSPMTIFYLSVTLDRWEKFDAAMFCLSEYLKLDDPDTKKREFVRRRLDYLLERFGENPYFPFRSIAEIIESIIGDED